MSKRVVVTGMAAFTPIGNCWSDVKSNLENNLSGVVQMEDWKGIAELNTQLAAPVSDFSLPKHYTRKKFAQWGGFPNFLSEPAS